ncbi:PEGA domain-containing protein [Candidatus Woesebacteria bacterium]|nr:PEGA domain-containing protein [Candidatus Woesebacteria bacterium]
MLFVLRKIILGIIFVAVLITVIAIARGYRFSAKEKTLSPTGILVASSFPDGSMIFVNGELKGATNSNIIVAPGEYDVEIKKDGYSSWKKHLNIKGELVIKADALLFPQNPTLSPVTTLGVSRAVSSASGDKIVIFSETENAEKDGIYLFENVRNPITRINPLKPLILKTAFLQESANLKLASGSVEFSPNEDQMLLTTYVDGGTLTPTKNPAISHIYLLDTDSLTTSPFDVTNSVESVRTAWVTEQASLSKKALASLKKPLPTIAGQAFNVIAFSPDERKILYTASQSATLPTIINPPIIASNQTPEERNLQPGSIYVYDTEEDKNFKLFDVSEFGSLENATSSLLWFPDSAHIVIKEAKKFIVADYDGTNRTPVYAGPFDPRFFTMSKDGKLFILTNFNSEEGVLFDLYSVSLK